MYKIRFVLFLVIVAVLISCRATPSIDTDLPVESRTPANLPTTVSTFPVPTIPLPSASPARTPEPGLRSNGPYFGYFRQVPGYSDVEFVLMDADGEGRKVFDLPELVTDTSPIGTQYVAPDGKWLAFYTGYTWEFREGSIQSAYDLTLNIYNFNSGEIQTITPLLSKDYPENFAKAVQEINDSSLRPDDLQKAFLAGITRALAWSPDGKYLAFAGQMDGPSSDLYLYDMTTRGIQRLSNEDEELQWVSWSPDGSWILHGSRISSIDEWIEYSISAVSRNGLVIRNLGSGFASQWLNSHEFLVYRFGIERYQLQLVDVNSGKTTEIWKGQFSGYEVDPTGNWVAVGSLSSALSPEKELPGYVYGSLQLINLRSLERIQYPNPWFESPERFLHTPDGLVVPLPNSGIFASPDKKFWVEIMNNGNLRFYAQDLTMVRDLLIPSQEFSSENYHWPSDIQWIPDSSGLFVVYGRFNYSLYLVIVSSGEVNLVDFPAGTGRWINANQ